MTDERVKALIEQAAYTYPVMLRLLLSAMRMHQRHDEPAHAGTAPAALPLALGCVLAVRMADDPEALELADTLLFSGLAMQRGMVPPGAAGVELAANMLRRLEEGGAI